MSGRFELRQDEDTGRKFWFGGEEEWKDPTEVGEDGTLIVNADAFQVGTIFVFIEPDDAPNERAKWLLGDV